MMRKRKQSWRRVARKPWGRRNTGAPARVLGDPISTAGEPLIPVVSAAGDREKRPVPA